MIHTHRYKTKLFYNERAWNSSHDIAEETINELIANGGGETTIGTTEVAVVEEPGGNVIILVNGEEFSESDAPIRVASSEQGY
jgi:hypothetical protein